MLKQHLHRPDRKPSRRCYSLLNYLVVVVVVFFYLGGGEGGLNREGQGGPITKPDRQRGGGGGLIREGGLIEVGVP